ncbi:FAD-dependent oxidoreductase [Paracidovorax avenae]|uniref:NAD(P)/FAD-dependent oxidoreductase n=1 Tax=Paracidovorax avenae TaxID=80867 RepID=UPI000D17DC71|nr:FAD-binding oxidoreductase [Paracidovorax avenae]AVS70790.1 FAD-dependent oxidoreductase [Paracidovorax avenae]
MQFASYWLDTSEPFRSAAPGPVEGRCDVAIIGGGLTGSSAALALAKKGAKVVLLEASTIGNAASGRNGGMCNNGFAQDYGVMAARLGPEVAGRLYRAFDAGVDLVERLVEEERIDCSFARAGKIKLAAKPGHYDKLVRAQALLAASVDPDTAIVSRADLAAEVGSDSFHGGLLYRKGAGMHVGRFVRGLAEAAARRGAEMHEHSPMTGLRPASGGGHVIDTPRGRLQAAQVLLASGTSHTGPLGWIRRRIVPVGAFLIVTEPLPAAVLDRIMPRRRMAVDTNHMVTYFRTTPDNRLLLGGRARFAVSNETSDRKSGAILQASLRRIFPDLAQARIDYCWGGMVDMTRDRLPRAGERNGIYYSMGYSGHGTQMSTLMGSLMAEVMDGRTDLNPWKDFDWPAIPGHFGKPWFLPLVGAWYRLRDRLS